MKNRIAYSLIILALTSFPTFGQTSADLEKKFGAPIQVFEVARGVLMVPKYNAEGQICEAALESRHKTSEGFDLGDMLTEGLIESVLNRLAPAAERGEKDKLYGFSLLMGQSYQTYYNHEHITVVGSSCFKCSEKNMAVVIRWKDRPCPEK